MTTVTTDEYFGGCPHCGKTNGYRNAGRGHWFFCDDHRVMWHIGSNLFSSWEDETEAEQEEKWKHIENYTEVKPIYPDARDMHMASVVWHRAQAKQHLDMAEELEREHGLDPIEVAKQVEAAIDRRRVAKAEPRALDSDIPLLTMSRAMTRLLALARRIKALQPTASQRAIAKVVGVDNATIHRDLAVANATPSPEPPPEIAVDLTSHVANATPAVANLSGAEVAKLSLARRWLADGGALGRALVRDLELGLRPPHQALDARPLRRHALLLAAAGIDAGTRRGTI